MSRTDEREVNHDKESMVGDSKTKTCFQEDFTRAEHQMTH